jgi:hypothetical protein
MDAGHRKTLRAVVIEMRRLLEGRWDESWTSWIPGDLEQRLAAVGVRRDRDPIPVDELPHLRPEDRSARAVVDAWFTVALEAGQSWEDAAAALVREAAATWATRLLALRCMEARGLIADEVVLTKPAYGGRSLVHHRLARSSPAVCAGDDDGLYALFDQVFREWSSRLPLLFDPDTPAVALRPSPAALKRCIAMLSGHESVSGNPPAVDAVFEAPDALGWAYQYWNADENKRVFARAAGKTPSRKRHKIEGADIAPATQLFTEEYMVRYLLENTLGKLWSTLNPSTGLRDGWSYFLRGGEPGSGTVFRGLADLTVMDPACGSGHFLLYAFDLLHDMYVESGALADETEICRAILRDHLFGIDIDERAIQLAEAALWMKAADKCGPEFVADGSNLLATNLRLPRDSEQHTQQFLDAHPEDRPLEAALRLAFSALSNVDQLGSLLLVEEPVERELERLKAEEDRAVAERGAENQQPLFAPERLQRNLPIGVESFGAWKAKTLTALRVHFGEEAQAASLSDRFFRRSAGKALRALELLGKRYAVVVTNPPYMGSKNMGPVLKGYIKEHYPNARRDLFAAFILRCRDLCERSGRVGMVTLVGWMFTRSYNDFRGAPAAPHHKRNAGLVTNATLECIAQLGRHAFDEADPPSDPVLFVYSPSVAPPNHRPVFFRLSTPRAAVEQAALLEQLVAGRHPELQFRPQQRVFQEIPGSVLAYWLRPRFLELLASPPDRAQIEVCQGSATASDGRFLRWVWEVPVTQWRSDVRTRRWVLFQKGGGYRRWSGNSYWCIDRESGFARIRGFGKGHISHEGKCFVPGWTYSLIARLGFACRRMTESSIIGHKGPGVYLSNAGYAHILNSRTATFLLRALSPNLGWEVDTVARCPLPRIDEIDSSGAEFAVQLARKRDEVDPADANFRSACGVPLRDQALLHTVEGWLEYRAQRAYGLGPDDSAQVLAECGTPAAWLPLIRGTDQFDFSQLPESLRRDVAGWFETLPRVAMDQSDLEAAKGRVRAAYERGVAAGASLEDPDEGAAEDEEDSGDAPSSGGRPLPAQSEIEEIALAVGLHPISVVSLIEEGMEREGWRCEAGDRLDIEHRVSVLMLRLLGHRWPGDSGEQQAHSEADGDGIIPLVGGTGEPTAYERVKTHLEEAFPGEDRASIERRFARAVGMSLETWLKRGFFERHVQEFKRRPIAWQVQSRPDRAGADPAVAALVYFHSIDADTLPKLRTQYAGTIRTNFETELADIERHAPQARNERQAARREQLVSLIAEVDRFQESLSRVEAFGFDDGRMQLNAQAEARVKLTERLLGWAATDLRGEGGAELLTGAVDLGPTLCDALTAAFDRLPRWCAELVPEDEEEPAASVVSKAAPTIIRAAVVNAYSAWEKEWKAARAALSRADRNRLTQTVDKLKRAVEAWVPTGLSDWQQRLAREPEFDAVSRSAGNAPVPRTSADFVQWETRYLPDLNDGVRVNIAPLQRAGLIAATVLDDADTGAAVADRAQWRGEERGWVRAGELVHTSWGTTREEVVDAA